jgi:hypothetical protein
LVFQRPLEQTQLYAAPQTKLGSQRRAPTFPCGKSASETNLALVVKREYANFQYHHNGYQLPPGGYAKRNAMDITQLHRYRQPLTFFQRLALLWRVLR